MAEIRSDGRRSRASERELELRLALVCYGGVSLAIYMHGISREILNLARASRAHTAAVEDGGGSQGKSYRDCDPTEGEIDSQEVYFDILKAVSSHLSLRVIVDIVAGASAGGINAIMLARALAFDLSLDAHRSFWLDLADVGELLDPLGRAGLWSKPYMRPFLWGIGRWQRRRVREMGGAVEDPEVLKKLSLFTRSRWFKPPFSGMRMSEMMYDALLSTGDSHRKGRSLLPVGMPLDLFVTTTDFWGHHQAIALHDPPQINEREHRHIMHFRHVRKANGELMTHFDSEDLPALAFAARATSCFPGAFPPARLEEIDTLLAQRGVEWRGRREFVTRCFRDLIDAGENPEDAAFIDGSVLMNKPISLAMQAVQDRAAHREVDRRLVYIEPNPEVRRDVAHEVPGFFRTIKAAMSDIPRNQPIRDDLEIISALNEHVRIQRQVQDAVKPNVQRMIDHILGKDWTDSPDAERIAAWRHGANEAAARDAAYAYDGYARLKLLSVLSDVAMLLKDALRLRNRLDAEKLVDAWAFRTGIRPIGVAAREAQASEGVRWIGFLRGFDAAFRLRRLRYLIRRLNDLYAEGDRHGPMARQWLNMLKTDLYEQIERIKFLCERCATGAGRSAEDPLPDDTLVDRLLAEAEGMLGLEEIDRLLDARLARAAASCRSPELWREILSAFLGFAYYDVLIFPMTHQRTASELDEVKVDRISVNDANSLRDGSAREILKGVELGNFGAFFSRRFRENDYLWGRLTGAERLIDILASAVPDAVAQGAFDVRHMKGRLFLAILDAEAPHLPDISDEIAALRRLAEGLLDNGTASRSQANPPMK